MDKFVAGAMLNREIVLALINGEPITGFPLFHAADVPTIRGALWLARAAGVKVTRKIVNRVPVNGKLQTTVILWLKGSPTASAGISCDEAYGVEIASGLAFRNGVERILCERPMVWKRLNTELEWV